MYGLECFVLLKMYFRSINNADSTTYTQQAELTTVCDLLTKEDAVCVQFKCNCKAKNKHRMKTYNVYLLSNMFRCIFARPSSGHLSTTTKHQSLHQYPTPYAKHATQAKHSYAYATFISDILFCIFVFSLLQSPPRLIQERKSMQIPFNMLLQIGNVIHPPPQNPA